MTRAIFSILIIYTCVTGCGRVDQKTLDEILEKDASFRKAFEAKRRLSEKTQVLKNEFRSQKAAILDKIRALKEELKGERNKLNDKISSLRQELEPRIHELTVELEKVQAQYASALGELKDSSVKLKNINKLLTKKGELPLSGDEISLWNKRSGDLEKEIASQRDKIASFKDRIRTLKIQINLLKD